VSNDSLEEADEWNRREKRRRNLPADENEVEGLILRSTAYSRRTRRESYRYQYVMLPRLEYERCLVIFQATGRIYHRGSTTTDEKIDGFQAFSMRYASSRSMLVSLI
jgi:hypothetical protein